MATANAPFSTWMKASDFPRFKDYDRKSRMAFHKVSKMPMDRVNRRANAAASDDVKPLWKKAYDDYMEGCLDLAGVRFAVGASSSVRLLRISSMYLISVSLLYIASLHRFSA